MDVNQSSPTKEITIKGLKFVVPAPFSEGHVLKANEAAVLNQTLAENLRNNFAGEVSDAIEEAGNDVDAVDVNALQTALNEYIAEYEFGARRAGSGSGQPKLEPRVRIARNLAVSKIKEQLRKKNQKVSDYPAEKINELAMALIEKNPFFYEEADRQLAAAQATASESIDLSDLGEPVVETEATE